QAPGVRAGVALLPGGAAGPAGRADRVRDAAPPPARPAAGRPGAGVPAELQPAWPRGARGGFLIGGRGRLARGSPLDRSGTVDPAVAGNFATQLSLRWRSGQSRLCVAKPSRASTDACPPTRSGAAQVMSRQLAMTVSSTSSSSPVNAILV